jgi:ferric-dicitrate binding protein FerR (iron transport regulator)
MEPGGGRRRRSARRPPRRVGATELGLLACCLAGTAGMGSRTAGQGVGRSSGTTHGQQRSPIATAHG